MDVLHKAMEEHMRIIRKQRKAKLSLKNKIQELSTNILSISVENEKLLDVIRQYKEKYGDIYDDDETASNLSDHKEYRLGSESL
tara:strand:- start:865 stop:1116 length:252 start_codon:yes stop_codon:yes gene_type:complete